MAVQILPDVGSSKNSICNATWLNYACRRLKLSSQRTSKNPYDSIASLHHDSCSTAAHRNPRAGSTVGSAANSKPMLTRFPEDRRGSKRIEANGVRNEFGVKDVRNLQTPQVTSSLQMTSSSSQCFPLKRHKHAQCASK